MFFYSHKELYMDVYPANGAVTVTFCKNDWQNKFFDLVKEF